MIAFAALRLALRVTLIVMFASLIAVPARASHAAVDPELEKQEREAERLLKIAEAEFWSLRSRLERDRTARDRRLVQARADYETAQRTIDSATQPGTAEHDLATYRADKARERYQAELESAVSGVDAARVELNRIEARVSKYRAALEALRRKSRNARQHPGTF